MKKALAITAIAFYLLPAMVSAAALSPYWGPLVSCTGGTPGGSDEKVCESFCDLVKTAQNFLKFAMTIAIYVIAPIFFVWGGIMILTAGGSEKRVTEARKMLTSVAIGIGIILGSYVIINTFFFLMGVVFPTNSAQSSWSEIKCVAPPVSDLEGTEEYSCYSSSGTAGDICYSDNTCGGECESGETCEADSECTAPPPVEDGNCSISNINACIQIPGNIASFKNGNKADVRMVDLLTCLNQKPSTWNLRITEAMPPSSKHKDPRHNNGCAVDATLHAPPAVPADCAKLNTLISDISSCGGSVLNEYFTTCGGTNTELSTGEHLHIKGC